MIRNTIAFLSVLLLMPLASHADTGLPRVNYNCISQAPASNLQFTGTTELIAEGPSVGGGNPAYTYYNGSFFSPGSGMGTESRALLFFSFAKNRAVNEDNLNRICSISSNIRDIQYQGPGSWTASGLFSDENCNLLIADGADLTISFLNTGSSGMPSSSDFQQWNCTFNVYLPNVNTLRKAKAKRMVK